MKKRNKKITIAVVASAIIAAIIIILLILFNNRSSILNIVPDGYVAVFHGGGAEVTRETYIYKDNNGEPNRGFTYVSTETIWGVDPENARTEILKRGSFEWTDGAFSVAEENRAYSYVTIPGDNKTYTIEEFMNRFLMD